MAKATKTKQRLLALGLWKHSLPRNIDRWQRGRVIRAYRFNHPYQVIIKRREDWIEEGHPLAILPGDVWYTDSSGEYGCMDKVRLMVTLSTFATGITAGLIKLK